MFNFLLNTFLKTTGSQTPDNTTKTSIALNSGCILFVFFIIAVVFFIIIVALHNMKEKIQDLEKKIEANNTENENTDEKSD